MGDTSIKDRKGGRKAAFQIIYQMDMQGLLPRDSTESTVSLNGEDISAQVASFSASFDVSERAEGFARRLVEGTCQHLQDLDREIMAVSRHWKLRRMSGVDRSLLRIAAYEITRCEDIPKAVSINEAVELAKSFSGENANAFVNGILDKL